MVSTGFIGLVAALAVLVAGCGDDGPVSNGIAIATNEGTPDSPRTIEIAMVDIAFQPTAVTVQAGETVRFVFTNDGTLEHEATFGDETEQEEHAAEMREAEGMDMDGMDMHGTNEPGDDGHGDEVSPLVLEPGASGDVIMTFDDPDVPSTIIGCHVPGHWEAGMRVDVTIATA